MVPTAPPLAAPGRLKATRRVSTLSSNVLVLFLLLSLYCGSGSALSLRSSNTRPLSGGSGSALSLRSSSSSTSNSNSKSITIDTLKTQVLQQYKNTKNPTDIRAVVQQLVAMSPISAPGLASNYEPVAKGLWRVVSAPHIRALEKVLFTTFDVSYCLDGCGAIKSNVLFQNALFSGWLNAEGTYSSLSDSDTNIRWERLWLDINTKAPSASTEVERHVLPELVQTVGSTAFVEAVSRFPVSFLDDSLCIFG
jgi:hypothetical protein